MRELQAKHGIEVQRAKDLEEALAQREVDLKTKSVELNELESMVAKREEEATQLNAHLMKAKRDLRHSDGLRRKLGDEINEANSVALSLRSQLAKSEELRVEAWTKLQTVYSGDEASHLVKQARPEPWPLPLSLIHI